MADESSQPPKPIKLFRLPNRRSRSEGDVSTLLLQQGPRGITTPVFVPPQDILPPFDPTRELYASPIDSIQTPMDSSDPTNKFNPRIVELEAQLAHLQDEHTALEQDLVDYRADLLNTRTELYSEMLCSARHQQRAMDDFRTIQKLETRHQRFCTMLVDIGIPRPTVEVICQVIQSGDGSPDDILVNAIKNASNDDTTLLARLKPIITAERTPEHYQSALNMTLSIRKELKSQKKRSKFWKKLAQKDDQHASTVTPSPSDISSIREDLSPERRGALEALIARRRGARHSENAEGDVFGGQRRESALETLASSLASRPRRSIEDNLRLSSSSFSSSSTSASTTYFSYFSGLSRIPRDSTTETPTIQSRLPSTLSTSLRRSSRNSSQSIVLGSVNLNVSRSSSMDPTLVEEAEQNTNPEGGPVSTITLSQDLLQNVRRASQGHGHRRVSSTASRRSVPARPSRSSFRLSAFSPIRATRPTGPPPAPDSDISSTATADAPSFHTPDILTRLSDLATSVAADTDTPVSASSEVVTSSEDTPFNDARALPKFGVDTPLSPTELEPRVASTPLEGCGGACTGTRFLEHVDCSMSMSMTVSVSTSVSESSAHVHGGRGHEHRGECERERERGHHAGTIPLGESNDSLFTTSTSASASASSSLAATDTTPTTPPTPCPSPVSGPSPSPSLCATPPSSTGTGTGAGIGTGAGTGTGTPSIRRSMLPVLAKHLRRLSLSPSPDRERLMDRLRGLRSLSRSSKSKSKSKSRSRSGSVGSRSRSGSGSGSGSVSGSRSLSLSRSRSRSRPGSGPGSPLASGSLWRSPARSASSRSASLGPSPSPTPSSSPSPSSSLSPVKGSGIPVLQRRMTIRARRVSVRKV